MIGMKVTVVGDRADVEGFTWTEGPAVPSKGDEIVRGSNDIEVVFRVRRVSWIEVEDSDPKALPLRKLIPELIVEKVAG